MTQVRRSSSRNGQVAAMAIVLAALASPAGAARVITSISFSGQGTVTSSSGPEAPGVGTPDSFTGSITFSGSYIDQGATGRFDGIDFPGTDSSAHDSILPGAYYDQRSWSITLDHGNLVSLMMFNENIELATLILTENTFSQKFYYYSPDDLIIHRNDYAGVWRLGPVTITTDAIPEPATWSLLLSGFGLAGATYRHSRRRFAAA